MGDPESPANFAWSRARLAVRHDRMFEDVKHVGALMEE
jgi:hypothetical protein